MSTAREDLPIDVCISRPDAGGGREKHFFRNSGELLQALVEWKSRGTRDILLTWGTTSPEAKHAVEEELRRAEVEYRCPQVARGPAPGTRPVYPFRALVKRIALGALAFVIGAVVGGIASVPAQMYHDARNPEPQFEGIPDFLDPAYREHEAARRQWVAGRQRITSGAALLTGAPVTLLLLRRWTGNKGGEAKEI
jgi:hypothetical protein